MGRRGRLARAAAIAAAVLAVPVLVIWHEHIWWWVEIHTGTVNESGPFYGFFSGFGSDLSEVAILGGLIAVVRKHNCEVRGCWRLGRHATAAGHHVCRAHHPDDHLTHQDVLDAHAAARPGLKTLRRGNASGGQGG